MLERTQRRLLTGTLLLGIMLMMFLYVSSVSKNSADLRYVQSQEGVLMESVKKASGALSKIPSGKSKVFVDEFGRITIPPADTVNSLDMVELEEIFFRYIENIQTLCIRMFHMGNEHDGGYHICETYFVPGNCLVYSFGIRKDFSFDDAVAYTYNCEVHSFDPGDGQKDHKHNDKVTFHAIGIGGEDKTMPINGQNWKIMSFDSIKKMLGHTGRKLDVVKIDTEAAEWDSLETMIKTGVIKDINMLIVEFHEWIHPGNHPKLPDARTPEKFRRYLNIMRGIYESGFRIYFLRMWPWCHYLIDGIYRTACHEVHFVNIDRSRFS